MAASKQRVTRSLYAYQLAEGFRWLRFEGELEAYFRDSRMRDYLPQLRLNTILGVLVYSSTLMLDWSLLSASVWHWTLTIRVAVAVTALTTLILTYTRISQRALTAWIMASVTIAGVGLAPIAAIVATAGIPAYFGWFSLICIYIYFMAGLLLYEAALCGLLVFISMVLAGLVIDLAAPFFLYHLVALFLANFFGLIGCYALESSNRANFLRTQLLNDMAERDGLTGVHNRGFFEEAAAANWAHAARDQTSVALMMVDVDSFKAYNDRYGHPAGDHCLVAVSAVLSRHAQRPLDIVARYGGEEFVVLWYGINADAARQRGETVREEILAMNIEHQGAAAHDNKLTISAGIAVVTPSPGANLSTLIRTADQALYEAKRRGRNCCVIRPITAASADRRPPRP